MSVESRMYPSPKYENESPDIKQLFLAKLYEFLTQRAYRYYREFWEK